MRDADGAAPTPARRRSPWPWVGGVVGLLVAVALGVYAFAASGAKDETSAPRGDSTAQLAGVAETKALLDGIEQRGFTIGDPDAPVVLLEYLDLQCPYCKIHQLDVQPTLVKELVRTGQAQISFVPLAFLGPQSVDARNVFMRLARKNRAWEFTNLFYFNQGQENSGYVTPSFLKRLVAEVPGAAPADASTEADPEAAAMVQAADALGQAVLTKHESGTPGFAVGAQGGAPATYRWIPIYQGEPPAEQIVKAVRQERKRVLSRSERSGAA